MHKFNTNHVSMSLQPCAACGNGLDGYLEPLLSIGSAVVGNMYSPLRPWQSDYLGCGSSSDLISN